MKDLDQLRAERNVVGDMRDEIDQAMEHLDAVRRQLSVMFDAFTTAIYGAGAQKPRDDK